jgi:hypothetical protein
MKKTTVLIALIVLQNLAFAQFAREGLSFGLGYGLQDFNNSSYSHTFFNFNTRINQGEKSSFVFGFNYGSSSEDYIDVYYDQRTTPATRVDVAMSFSSFGMNVDYHRYLLGYNYTRLGLYALGGLGFNNSKITQTYDSQYIVNDVTNDGSVNQIGMTANLGIGFTYFFAEPISIFGEIVYGISFYENAAYSSDFYNTIFRAQFGLRYCPFL